MGAQFSCFLMFFFCFCVFCVLGGTSKIAVLPAWELNFRKLDQHFYVFLIFLAMLKKHVFTCLSFSCFFTIFGVFLEASGLLLASFWSLCRLFGFLVSSFWVPLARLGSLWTLSAAFCDLFVVSLARLGCLWARGPLRECFLLHFLFIFVLFFEQFGGGFLSFFDFCFERCCVRFLFLVRLFGYFS